MRRFGVKLFWLIVRPLQLTYWFLLRPKTYGVKSMVRRSDGAYLLVRLTYAHRRWTFPGGSVNRGESPHQAAVRELKEETSVALTSLVPLCTYEQNLEFKQDTVEVFYATALEADPLQEPDGFEVAEIGWFFPTALPKNRVPRVDELIAKVESAMVAEAL